MLDMNMARAYLSTPESPHILYCLETKAHACVKLHKFRSQMNFKTPQREGHWAIKSVVAGTGLEENFKSLLCPRTLFAVEIRAGLCVNISAGINMSGACSWRDMQDFVRSEAPSEIRVLHMNFMQAPSEWCAGHSGQMAKWPKWHMSRLLHIFFK